MSVIALLAALGVLVLAVVAGRARREAARLERRVQETAGDLEDLRRAFSRFAPDPVIERVIADGVRHRGEKKDVTVLFADIVEFTALSERLDPDVLVRVLNGYFERMSRVISEHRGFVSTFVGDGLLALFGALAPNPWQANDAVHAALAMRAALADYTRELDAEGLLPLAIGVGVQRGPAVAGLVGSRELMQFTCIGRAVNMAARVQALTRQFETDVILTDAVAAGLEPRFTLRPLPPTAVKGIREPLVVFAAEGFDGGR
jgi:adenylate cyclase